MVGWKMWLCTKFWCAPEAVWTSLCGTLGKLRALAPSFGFLGSWWKKAVSQVGAERGTWRLAPRGFQVLKSPVPCESARFWVRDCVNHVCVGGTFSWEVGLPVGKREPGTE